MDTTLREVNVSLYGDTVTFAGPGISNGKISIPTAIGQIVFRIQGSLVNFPSAPIQWTMTGQSLLPQGGTFFLPTAQPDEATVSRKSNWETEITITNPSLTMHEYSFFVLVQTPNGKFFGTDPTIVTMRPPDPNDGR